jgi:hypothetical protein
MSSDIQNRPPSSRDHGTTAFISAKNRSRRVWRFLLAYSALEELVCFMAASSLAIGISAIVEWPNESALPLRSAPTLTQRRI